MSSLSKALKDKLTADGLTPAQGATKAGVNAVSFNAALSGKSVPNARSIDKYAQFLGISVDEVKAMGAGAGGKARRGRPPGSGKRRGRPPGSGKAKAKGTGKRRGRPPGSGTGKRRGRPPGSGTGKRRGRPPGSARGGLDADAALARIGEALASANGLLGDTLAMKVHALGKRERSVIEALVNSIG